MGAADPLTRLASIAHGSLREEAGWEGGTGSRALALVPCASVRPAGTSPSGAPPLLNSSSCLAVPSKMCPYARQTQHREDRGKAQEQFFLTSWVPSSGLPCGSGLDLLVPSGPSMFISSGLLPFSARCVDGGSPNPRLTCFIRTRLTQPCAHRCLMGARVRLLLFGLIPLRSSLALLVVQSEDLE